MRLLEKVKTLLSIWFDVPVLSVAKCLPKFNAWLFCITRSAQAAGRQNGKQHVRFQSQNLSFVKVCVYVLCLPKNLLRAPRKTILTNPLESKWDASWYFSLHASPFVSFNYSLVVNKLLSCWCFISHSDCYDNVFVCVQFLKKLFRVFKLTKIELTRHAAVVRLKKSCAYNVKRLNV